MLMNQSNLKIRHVKLQCRREILRTLLWNNAPEKTSAPKTRAGGVAAGEPDA